MRFYGSPGCSDGNSDENRRMPNAIPFTDLAKVFPGEKGTPKPLQMESSGGGKPRILLGEDDPIETLAIFQCLAEAGYEIVVATNGTDAVTELRKADHPPVAILERQLPGMSGLEICERMRDAGKHVYLILLATYPTTADIIAGLETGADLYLSKSIPPRELLAHVKVGQRIIERQRTLAQKVEELTGGRPAVEIA